MSRCWRSCLTVLVLAAAACSHAPRPTVLDQSKATAESEGLAHARRLAPQAYARAEGLQQSAERAHREGRSELAAALAARALVAFERAAVQAQKVEATERIAVANHASTKRELEIAKLSAVQEAIAAETKRLELRVEIATNTVPRTPIEPTGGQRAAAQAETARSIAESARLLCVAARLVTPKNEAAGTQLQAAEGLLAEVGSLPPHTALERALDQRIQCLTVLTKSKRTSSRLAPDTGDELLSSLSPSFSDLRPHRDDRGVVLTALAAWDGRQLTPTGRDVADRVSKLASARPTPLLVVLHPTPKSGSARTPSDVPTELTKLFPKASVVEATTALPSLLDLPNKEKHAGRMEFIFVTP